MATKKKLLQAAAGNAGGAGLDVESVFSTYLYEGNGDGSAATNVQTINNGIDLSGEGGMVWIKGRSHTTDHIINDTVRGAGNTLQPNLSDANQTGYYDISQFNSNGFGLDAGGNVNNNGYDYASWTFRKAPKFFDVVTWTGDGVAGKTISHNLGTTVGSIFVKRTSGADNWTVYHRGVDATAPEDYTMYLNTTEARSNQDLFFDTAPTDSVFYLGDNVKVNGNGSTYVAYLFAHNDGDGDFGQDSDQDIIKCGSYTGDNGSTGGVDINLGFEPQWVMVKAAEAADNWYIIDNMRGWVTHNNTANDEALYANATNAESTLGALDITSTGFKTTLYSNVNVNGRNYIYMAIRRGTKVPESATEVFSPNLASGYPRYPSGFATDFVIQKSRSSGGGSAYSRLMGANNLDPSTTAQESASAWDWAQMTGSGTNFTDTTYVGWSWKRAPSYFDVVAYTGTGVAGHTVSHNLTVAPEMMWVKCRDTSLDWAVYTATTGNNQILKLNTTGAALSPYNWWNYTTPTDSVFTLGGGTNVNGSGKIYIAYLFASLPGISKVGSYTGTGATLNIDCGFTSGARFVLLKRTDSAEEWRVFDTVRGIVAGNDPLLHLNSTGAEEAFDDLIDPYSAGFSLTSSGMVNASGGSYIFYAIA